MMGWRADGQIGQCINCISIIYLENVTIGKIGQWGNGKMGNWGYVYKKKGMEAILNWKQEQVQACKP